jgi:hypothetical protein
MESIDWSAMLLGLASAAGVLMIAAGGALLGAMREPRERAVGRPRRPGSVSGGGAAPVRGPGRDRAAR